MIHRINTMPVSFAGVSMRMIPPQFLRSWNHEMIALSQVHWHGSLDSATAMPVLLAHYRPSLLCVRASRVGTSPRGERATSPGTRTVRNLSARRDRAISP